MDPVGIVPGRLYHLQPVLKEWVKLNQHCVDNWEGDIPWRYDELAALSWFAGAIWRKDGFAIAEYSRHKSDAKRAFGRGDLWFKFQDKECDIEAKLCRVPLNVHRYNPERLIMRMMSKAEKDIKASRPYSDERIRCAVLFSILSIDFTKAGATDVISGPEFETRVSRWLGILKSREGDAVAWFVRDDKEWGRPTDGKHPEVLFPGVAVILRAIDSTAPTTA